jgi:hypothetical protein
MTLFGFVEQIYGTDAAFAQSAGQIECRRCGDAEMLHRAHSRSSSADRRI